MHLSVPEIQRFHGLVMGLVSFGIRQGIAFAKANPGLDLQRSHDMLLEHLTPTIAEQWTNEVMMANIRGDVVIEPPAQEK